MTPFSINKPIATVLIAGGLAALVCFGVVKVYKWYVTRETCDSFTVWPPAQESYFKGNKRLDRDGDKIACDELFYKYQTNE